MKLIVCGGRNFSDRARAYAALDLAHQKRWIERLAHGACRGADALARDWARERGVLEVGYAPDWSMGPAGGPARNQRMLDAEAPDGLLALPGGRGTADMVARARRAGVPVWAPFGL